LKTAFCFGYIIPFWLVKKKRTYFFGYIEGKANKKRTAISSNEE